MNLAEYRLELVDPGILRGLVARIKFKNQYLKPY